jgi:site-specific recombinase XerD
LDQGNALRGLHLIEEKLGLPTFGWHRLRHAFATNYLRHGGDIVRLSMVLGHSQITMPRCRTLQWPGRSAMA